MSKERYTDFLIADWSNSKSLSYPGDDHKVDYIVIFPDGAFSYTEEAGVFSVTEIFEVFIEGIED